MVKLTKAFLLILTIIILCFFNVDCQKNFTKRYTFSLGNNVTVAKFSPDYTVLLVLRQSDSNIYSYNPVTFQLIGKQHVDYSPIDLQIYQNYVIVVGQFSFSYLYVYQRKIGSQVLTLKQKQQLKYVTDIISGLKLQKLDQDFNDKGQANATRHVVVWHPKSFEVYKFVASQSNPLSTSIFNKSYQTTNQAITDCQFFDQKFLVIGLKKSATAGQINLLQLDKLTVVPSVSILGLSMKAFNIKPSTPYVPGVNYLSIGQSGKVGQFKSTSRNISQSNKQIDTMTASHIFYDNNKIIGFYNNQHISVFRATQVSSFGYPNYDSKFSQSKKPQQPEISIVAMPQNTTGQFITNNCQQNGAMCFYYYSLCQLGTYYDPGLSGQSCTKCKTGNCSKCYNNQCAMCNNGFYVDSTKKCVGCSTQFYGCTSCSQNGKTCHTCDTSKQFDLVPVNNVCQCIKGKVYDTATKKCVQCITKIANCSVCGISDDHVICNICSQDTNRVPSGDSKTCVCNPQFYFQNASKICQLCDPNKKCKTCKDSNSCQQCDTKNFWTLNDQSKCVCMTRYVEVNNKCLLCNLLGCDTCQTDTTCKQCQFGFELDANKQCVCNQNRYLNGTTNKCDLCSDYLTGCYKCSDNSKCALCDEKQKFRNSTPTAQGKCICKNSYTQNTKKQCVLCSTPGCLNCESQNMCTICDKNNGFNQTINNGKCSCVATKYLETNTCKNCVEALPGCQLCDNGAACKTCNTTANYQQQPVNGSCNCLQNYFVSQGICLQCKVICQHCQKCVMIVSSDLGSPKVGCSTCEDDYEVQDSKCVQKSSNSWVYILVGIGILTILIVIGVCYIMKKRAKKQRQQERRSKQTNSSIISSLLKQNDPQVYTTDRTQIGSKKSQYEPLFNGNINYSISSQQRQSDKKLFNQSLKELQRQRKKEFDRKKNSEGYTSLSKNIKSTQKRTLSDQQVLDKKKQSLFSHRGKG